VRREERRGDREKGRKGEWVKERTFIVDLILF
jgi:hypothetical protein